MNTTNYKPKNYETIFMEMLTDAYVEGLLSTDEHFLDYIKNRQDIENNFILTMSVYSLKDSKQYDEMTNIYLSNDLDYAIGVDLDTLGEKCATFRPQATRSSVELIFSLPNDEVLDYDYVIPGNTIVSTKDGLSYATVRDATIIRGEYNTRVGALSIMSGGGNRADPYTLTETTLPLNVTNPKGSSGTHEAYNDNQYRDLLRNWTYSHIRGTKEAYEEFFANYEGLDDYRLIPKWDGAGTMKIIIDPSDDWLINDLYEKLQEKTFLLIEDVLITGAVERPLDIDCTINVDIDNVVEYSSVDYDQIKNLVENALMVYVNGGTRRDGTYYKGLSIGQDFIPFKAGVFVNEEIPQLMSIDFKDTLGKIDNIIHYDEFIEYDPNDVNLNVEVDDVTHTLKGSKGQKCKTDMLYANYPYMVESDNQGFTLSFKKQKDNGIIEELFNTKQSKFALENIDLYGGWIELTANRDNATISYIRLYENDSDNDNYNTHVCINNGEKAVLRNVVVKVQGEENAQC